MNHSIKLNEEGVKLYQEKRYEDALLKFKSAVEIDKNNASIWKNLGDCQYSLNQIQEAFHSYEVAIKLDANKSYQLYLDFAVMNFSQGKYSIALKLLLQAEIHPNFLEENKVLLYHSIALNYFHLKEFTLSLRYFNKLEKILGLNKKSPDQYELICSLYYELKDFSTSVKLLEEGLCYYPDSIELLQFSFIINEKYHLYGQALQLFETKQSIFTNNLELYLKFLKFCYNNKDFCRIVKNEELIKNKLSENEISMDIQKIQTNSRESLKTILNFIKQPESPVEGEYSSSPQAYYLLRALYMFYIREFNVVERNIALSLKEKPDTIIAIFIYGLAKLFNSDYNSALKMFNIYSKYDTELWITSFLKSYLYFKIGDEKNMEENWDLIPNKEFILKELVKKEDYFETLYIKEDIFGITYDFIRNKLNLDD